MTPAEKLQKARDLMRRAASNRATYYRASCDTKTARSAMDRADRQLEAADALFEEIRILLETTHEH